MPNNEKCSNLEKSTQLQKNVLLFFVFFVIVFASICRLGEWLLLSDYISLYTIELWKKFVRVIFYYYVCLFLFTAVAFL